MPSAVYVSPSLAEILYMAQQTISGKKNTKISVQAAPNGMDLRARRSCFHTFDGSRICANISEPRS